MPGFVSRFPRRTREHNEDVGGSGYAARSDHEWRWWNKWSGVAIVSGAKVTVVDTKGKDKEASDVYCTQARAFI